MATTSTAKAAETTEAQVPSETADGIETEPAKGMKAYKSDRNLAEVNADEVFYMDPKSDLGKRLLSTGYVTETEDPQA